MFALGGRWHVGPLGWLLVPAEPEVARSPKPAGAMVSLRGGLNEFYVYHVLKERMIYFAQKSSFRKLRRVIQES